MLTTKHKLAEFRTRVDGLSIKMKVFYWCMKWYWWDKRIVICKIVSSQPFEFFPGETAYLYWNGPQTPIMIAYVSAWQIITEIKSTLSYLILSYQKEYAIKPSSRRTANMSRRLWVFLWAFSNAADSINNDVNLLLTIHYWRIVQDVAICRLVASWSLT